jgi:transmembrane sensor
MGRRAAAAPSLRDVAIDWMVTLHSGEAGAADRERHRAWLQADARHRQAWAEVEQGVRRAVAPVKADAAARRAALALPGRRRALGGVLALAGVGTAAGWLAYRHGPAGAWLADLRTGIGERREFALEDGSRLLLNAGSAVDVRFGAAERLVVLRAGALVATAEPDAARPFVVRTAEGEVRADAARLLVRQEEAWTLAGALARPAQVRTRAGRERRLQEGEAVRFDAAAVADVPGPAAGLAARGCGMLVADDLPLGEVVAQLRPYRAGFIRVSRRAASLRVLGAFALEEPERVLDSLAQTLPIRLARYGGWLTAISTRDET